MTVVVRGYKEFLKATALADKDVKREVREAFRAVGKSVRNEGEDKFIRYGKTDAARRSHIRSATRFKVKVRQRGVEVEQTLGKTTGLHPEYGPAQMRHALLPALHEDEPFLRRRMEKAMDRVVDIFERRTI